MTRNSAPRWRYWTDESASSGMLDPGSDLSVSDAREYFHSLVSEAGRNSSATMHWRLKPIGLVKNEFVGRVISTDDTIWR